MKRKIQTEIVNLTLPASNVANFSFFQLEAVTISVPAGSPSRMETRWHFERIDARSVRCISGRLVVSTRHRESRWSLASIDEAGLKEASTNFQHTSLTSATVGSHDTGNGRTIIKFPTTIVFVADLDRSRQFCNVAHDSYVCAHMHSPPYWFRMLLRFSCDAQQRFMLDVAHYIRTEMLLYAMDYHVYCGLIPFSMPWRCWSDTSDPPDWTLELEIRSMLWTSKLVTMTCYWVGSALGIDSPRQEYVAGRLQEKTDEERA